MINAEEFWKNAAPEGECRVWTGQVNKKPVYGVYEAVGGRLSAHRVAHSIAIGPVPKGAHVVHTCGNPLCVAPEHLRLANPLAAADPLSAVRVGIQERTTTSNNCWVWKGVRPKSIVLPTGIRLLVRGVYEAFHSPLRKSQRVEHTCGNGECLNPEHLSAVARKGGLSADQVSEIRMRANESPGKLAEQFDTTRQTIHSVVYNLAWHDPAYTPPDRREKIAAK